MSIVRKITDSIFSEIKAILREYAHETEVAVKRRIKRLVLMAIVSCVLVSLVITMLGTASLFLMIGELKYLSLSMPEWEAFDIMGITAAVIAIVLFLVLFLIIRKQLNS